MSIDRPACRSCGAVQTCWCIPAARRMDGQSALESRTQGRRHRVERGMLVRVQRVATVRRDRDPVQAGARRRSGLETPVGVPVLGEQRRRLVGVSLDRDHVFAALDRSDERVVTERSEVQREPFEVVVGHRLAGEGEDVMLEPCGTDLGDRRIVEWAAEVDAGDRGTARLTRWPNLDPHQRNPTTRSAEQVVQREHGAVGDDHPAQRRPADHIGKPSAAPPAEHARRRHRQREAPVHLAGPHEEQCGGDVDQEREDLLVGVEPIDPCRCRAGRARRAS